MLLSEGQLVTSQVDTLADTTPIFADRSYYPSTSLPMLGAWAAYGALYRKQLWVGIVVRKLSWGTSRLPFEVKRQLDVFDQALEPGNLADLLAAPNERLSGFRLWLWTVSTFEIYGEAFWLKLRDSRGRVRELHPIHPTNLIYRVDPDTGAGYWYYALGGRGLAGALQFPEADVVSFLSYNPDTLARGLSNLEGLRETLFNEDAARRATASWWQRGARPSVALKHPNTISEGAQERLLKKWESNHAGADLMGGTAILEEGMEAQIIQLSAEEMQYIESRKLNREEVCSAFDVSPVVVHILDHATYSNVTEQLRGQYRDTMAPKLQFYESCVNHSLVPDFYPAAADEIFGRFNMDEVMRGDFEVRAEAGNKLITSGVASPAEVRPMMNLPKSKDPAADRLYGNAALVPLGSSVRGAQEVDANGNLIPTPLPGTTAGTDGTGQGLPPVDPSPAKALGTKAAAGPTWAMVAVYPTAEQAAAIAVAGGEDPAELHVTLAFLGTDVTPEQATLAGTVAASIAAQHQVLAGTVGGLGQFPDTGDGIPRYAPVDVPGLAELRTRLVTQLEAAGITVAADHGFTPHMTLVYGDADTPAPDPLQPIPVTFGALVVVRGDVATPYPLNPPAAAKSTRAVDVRALARRLGRVKAAGGNVRGALVDEHTKAVGGLFDRQMAAAADNPDLALAGYDDELAGILATLGLATSKAIGDATAKNLAGTFDVDRISDWIRTDAGDSAAAINATTQADLAEHLAGADDQAAAIAGFATALQARAADIADSRVTRVGGLSQQVAAEQAGAASKTWVAGPNPRPSHAALDGETVALGELFSNGMNGPGDPAGGADEVAGCDCSLDFILP